jgi:hypothetical protein
MYGEIRVVSGFSRTVDSSNGQVEHAASQTGGFGVEHGLLRAYSPRPW